jgi:hypothetical protein
LLGASDSDIDLALKVEREHALESDLVAALQFESSAAAGWGSRELEAAVVRRAAALAPRLDFFRGLHYGGLVARTSLLAVVLACWLAVAAIYPRHVAAFAQRMMLSAGPYPSQTMLEQILVNRKIVYRREKSNGSPQEIRCARNSAVAFLVQGSGKLPLAGRVECRSTRSVDRQTLDLRPVAARAGWYSAELPALLDEIQYTIQCGDALSAPAIVRVVELPAVELTLEVTAPDYAGGQREISASPQQVSVLEGSQIRLSARCVNGKQLQTASIHCWLAGQEMQFSLSPENTGDVWHLRPEGTPLASVVQEIRYEVRAADQDQLQPEVPLAGVIRLRPDRHPLVDLQAAHRMVVPTAEPVIQYRLEDDFAIARAELSAQVHRRQRNRVAPSDGQQSLPALKFQMPLGAIPLTKQRLPFQGEFPLNLTPLELKAGDQLKLVVEVVDHRGSRPGQSYVSEPLWIEVADEARVLAEITLSDQRAESALGEVVRRQLTAEEVP